MKKFFYFIVLFVLIYFSKIFPGYFGYFLPWDDDKANITDISFLNHKPAGKYGYVTIGSDGHFYIKSGTEKIKFFGVNFTSSSCFPSHSDAEKIARRLSKFGVNLVRFHLMDANWGESIINYSTGNSRTFNNSTLERFDYFFKVLKDNGIYSNINMLAGRDFLSGDGLPLSINTMNWKDKQTPAMFNQTMINLQKEFATNLLTHINPYTGLSYAEDPAVVFVEICNEHGLIHAWHNKQIDILPQEFKDELKIIWSNYLQNKYTTFSNLENSWRVSEPLGNEKLINNRFQSGIYPWVVEQHSPATVSYQIIQNGYAPGINSLDITVINTSLIDWHVQLNQSTSILKGHPYTLSFSAKASANTKITVLIQKVGGDWQTYFSRELNLTTNWQRFEFVFTVNGDEANARLNFANMADEPLTYSFADFSFRQGGEISGLKSGETDFNNINIFLYNDKFDRTDQAKKDWVDFLWQKEFDYWNEMNTHIKSINSHFLTIGTVIGNSTPNLMKIFDVIDSHGYWQHPNFVTDWSGPWWIKNSSIVKQTNGATISGLGLKRIHGKPFSVTEYNHPAPNTFSGEAYIFLSAYAAFQDWDAIYAYTYDDGTRTWAENRQNRYFDISRDPNKIISFIPSVLMFRNNFITPGSQLLRVSLTVQNEKELLPNVYAWRLLDANHVGMQYEAPLLFKSAIVTEGTSMPPGLSPNDISIPTDKKFISSTGELEWDTINGVFKINSQKIAGLVGYCIGKEYNFNNIKIRPISALQNWATLILTLRQGNSLYSDAEKILLIAYGFYANTGMDFRKYPENTPLYFPPTPDVDTTLANWGVAPTLAEGVYSEIVLPYSYNLVKVYKLDNTGEKVLSIPVINENGNAKFTISDTYQTLWYEINIYKTPPPTDTFTATYTFTSTPGGPTFTFTPTPTFTQSKTEFLLDDCEDANNINKWGGYWYTFKDPQSNILPSPQGNFYMSLGGAISLNYAVHITGYVAPQLTPNVYPYVGVGTQFNPNLQSVDISIYDGIKFWVKGNLESYNIRIPYTNNSGQSLTGYNDYKYSFIPASNWQELYLPFSLFTQEKGWGTTVPILSVLQNSRQLQWQIEGYGKQVDLWLDDIYFFKFTFTPTATFFATLTPTFTVTFSLHENETDINKVFVYPSLFNILKHKELYFFNLPEKFIIKIYNIKGEQIFAIDGNTKDGKYFFDIKNLTRKKSMSSGIYIYLVGDKKGKFKKGKFSIVR